MVDILLDPTLVKYWDAIKNASSDIKLKLISLLSSSLIEYPANKELLNSASKLELLKKVTGSWDDESAEDIISIIREHRSSKQPVKF